MKQQLFLLLVIISLMACNASKKNATSVSTNCKSIVQTNEMPVDLYDAAIKKVNIDKNCLIIDVEMAYNEVSADAFDLRWNGKMKKSMPPQVTLALHKDKGNEGFERKKYQLKFDLSTLSSMGKSIITLKGWDERIEYNPTTK